MPYEFNSVLSSLGDRLYDILRAKHQQAQDQEAFKQFQQGITEAHAQPIQMGTVPAQAGSGGPGQPTRLPVPAQPIMGVNVSQQQIPPNDPRFLNAAMQYMNASPGAASTLQTYLSLRDRYQPKYNILNQEGGGYDVFRETPGQPPANIEHHPGTTNNAQHAFPPGSYVPDPTAPGGYRQIGTPNVPAPFAFGGNISYVDANGNPVIAPSVLNKKTGETTIKPVGGAIPKPVGGTAGQKTGMAAYDPALEADRRLKVMIDAQQNPNPQNDVAMLFNHIGMTLSAQKGARITNAEIERAIKARSIPEDLQAMYQRVQNGQFLTPEQREHMVKLGVLNRRIMWETAKNKADFYGVTTAPKGLEGLPPLDEHTPAPADSSKNNDPLGIR